MATLDHHHGDLRAGRLRRFGDALVERIPRWLYLKTRAAIFEGRPEAEAAGSIPEGYYHRFADESDLPALSRMIDLPLAEYRRRHAAGDRCLAVYHDERPVNLNWVHQGGCYVRGAGFILEAGHDDSYIYGIYTDPSQRGKGLYKSALGLLTSCLRDSGSRRLIQMVEDGNTPVLKTLPRLGYRKVETILHLKLLGLKYTERVTVATGRVRRTIFLRKPSGLYWI